MHLIHLICDGRSSNVSRKASVKESKFSDVVENVCELTNACSGKIPLVFLDDDSRRADVSPFAFPSLLIELDSEFELELDSLKRIFKSVSVVKLERTERV